MSDDTRAQTPAEGISVLTDSDDYRTYRVDCECTSADHGFVTWVELDADEDTAGITFYVQTSVRTWNKPWRQKLKVVWDIITKGYYVTESDVLMRPQVLHNFIQVLKDAEADIEYNKERSNS